MTELLPALTAGLALSTIALAVAWWRAREAGSAPIPGDPTEDNPKTGSAASAAVVASDGAVDLPGRKIFNGLSVPLCGFTREGRFVTANTALVKLFDLPLDGDIPARDGRIMRLRLVVSQNLGDLNEVTGAGSAVAAVSLPSGDGDARDYELHLSRVSAPDYGFEIMGLVIPAHAAAADGPLEEAPFAVAVLGEGHRILTRNRAFDRLVEPDGIAQSGETSAETTKADTEHSAGDITDLAKLVSADGRAALDDLLSRAGRGETEIEPVELHLVGEEEIYISVTAKRLPGRGAPKVAVFAADVSRAKSLEMQFVQSQKMQAVGQLAGGVAHDFNNLLTAMSGFCDLLLMRHRPGDQSFADIMQIKQNANRAANLVRQLLAFSRQQTLIPRVLDVTETLADLSHLLRRLIGENVTLEIQHGRELPPIKVDQGQLEQVIINLVVNARDAMPGGGTITARTSVRVIEQEISQGDEVVPPGRYILLEVSDIGTGIAPEVKRRIFEPFYTTKESGAGTGLGLATVYGIVKQTGGFIFVDSRLDQGSNFSIFLPAHEGKEEIKERAAGRGPSDLTGVGTIMLVEDEDAVRMFAARALRNKGYTVIEARSGDAALELFQSDMDPIDLLITDVVMPGTDGPTLVRKVRETEPDLRVICISGYSEETLRERISVEQAVQFLPKPFSLRQLAGKVKEVLEA